jgi:hypothetical protein
MICFGLNDEWQFTKRKQPWICPNGQIGVHRKQFSSCSMYFPSQITTKLSTLVVRLLWKKLDIYFPQINKITLILSYGPSIAMYLLIKPRRNLNPRSSAMMTMPPGHMYRLSW